MATTITRRNFMKTAAFSIAAMRTGPAIAQTRSANEKLDIAIVGIGGRGDANYGGVRRENIVAVCDVDLERAGRAYGRFEKSQQFTDYRRMFDKAHKSFDAVVISTPDHTHFHPAYRAIDLGKHVYLEKPMAHAVWEVRKLTEHAKNKGVATQLGSQRHVKPNMHRVVELIQTGAIGDVTEVHSWVSSERGMVPAQEKEFPIPATLDYELWLGPAEDRPYDPNITPYGWRFWWDYGTGEAGNWGCHILDIPYWALDLGHATHVSATGPEADPHMTPKSFHSVFDFPAKGDRPALKLHWSQAKDGPEVLKKYGLPNNGNNLFVGTKGMLLCGFDHLKLLPEEDFADFEAPAPFIPDSPGFHKEFIQAAKGDETPPTCHFGYTGPMTETVLLGNAAFRTKADFDWDHETMTCKGAPETQALIKPAFKEGWEMNV